MTKEIVERFYKAISEHYKPELLTGTSLWLIHTKKYNKPYTEEVKNLIDGYKNYIVGLVTNGTLNESNVLSRDCINECLAKYVGIEHVDEITKHEYLLAFTDLIKEEPLVRDLCVRALNMH